MIVTIPKHLQKQVDEHRKQLGLTPRDYVSRALTRFIKSDGTAEFYRQSGFDKDLAEELALWDRASLHDFNEFTKKHRL